MSIRWSGWKIVVAIFAVIGFIAVVAFLGMWAMHGSMMGRMSANTFGHSLASMCRMTMGTPHYDRWRISDIRFRKPNPFAAKSSAWFK